MENVTEIKKPQTDQEKLDELMPQCSRLFFEYGQLAYQIKCEQQQLGDLEIRLKNVNTEAHKLQAKIRMEEAKKLKVEGKDERDSQ
jgi:hypothetical protein